MQRLRIVVAEPDTAFKRAVREFLQIQNNVEIVAEAKSSREALQLVKRYLPDIVLSRGKSPRAGRYSLCTEIKESLPPNTHCADECL